MAHSSFAQRFETVLKARHLEVAQALLEARFRGAGEGGVLIRDDGDGKWRPATTVESAEHADLSSRLDAQQRPRGPEAATGKPLSILLDVGDLNDREILAQHVIAPLAQTMPADIALGSGSGGVPGAGLLDEIAACQPDVLILSLKSCAGFEDAALSRTLMRHEPGARAIELVDLVMLDAQIARSLRACSRFLEAACARRPGLRILAHGADLPGVGAGSGWLLAALAGCGIPDNEWADVRCLVRGRILDAFEQLELDSWGDFMLYAIPRDGIGLMSAPATPVSEAQGPAHLLRETTRVLREISNRRPLADAGQYPVA